MSHTGYPPLFVISRIPATDVRRDNIIIGDLPHVKYMSVYDGKGSNND